MTNVVLNPGVGGATLSTDTVGGVDTEIVKIGFSAAGIAPIQVSSANPFPTTVSNFPAIQNVAVTNFPANQAVTVTNVVAVQGSFTIASSATPINVVQDAQTLDDDGIPYVNPNVPGADIATGDKQTQGNALLAAILAAASAPATTPVFGTVSVTNFPSTQPVSLASTITVVPRDEALVDDDGIPFVNPNVPGADIATGDRQTQIIAALQATQPRSITGTVAIVGGVAVTPTITPLPANAALEVAGQLQKIADFLERILAQEIVNGCLLTQLSQPYCDDPFTISEDPMLLAN